MRIKGVVVVLTILITAGCAIFIPPKIFRVPVNSSVPREALETFRTVDADYRIVLEPYEDANEVSIKAPSGHYYEFGFWAALDSTLAQWADYKFTSENPEPDGTIHIHITKFLSKSENLNKATRDFLYQLGIVAELTIENHQKTFEKPVIVNLKVPVEGDGQSVAQLKEAIDYAILEFVIDIDLFVDRELLDR